MSKILGLKETVEGIKRMNKENYAEIIYNKFYNKVFYEEFVGTYGSSRLILNEDGISLGYVKPTTHLTQRMIKESIRKALNGEEDYRL